MSVPEASRGPLVVACMKRVELRAGVDPHTGAVVGDPASAGPSPADEAALEWALRIGECSGGDVVALSAGDASSEEMLRGAIAAGAQRGLVVPVVATAPSDQVAAALCAGVERLLASRGSSSVVVCCGDASVDRGSGSVPAFLAAALGAAQALGLVGVDLRLVGAAAPENGNGSTPEAVTAEAADPASVVLEVDRRLDGSRRERLSVRTPCVISVEAVTARLRRAPVGRLLLAANAKIEILDLPASLRAAAGPGRGVVELVALEPFRPRTRVVQPPRGQSARARIEALTGALHERPAARTLTLGPEEAADALLSALAEWGELPDGASTTGGPDSPADDLAVVSGRIWYRNHSQTLPDDAATTGAPDSPDEVEPAGAPPHAAAHDDETENP